MALIETRLAGIQVRGHSVAGTATTIDFPELRLAFDLGGAFERLVSRRRILFTHAHVDHMGAIAWHAAMRGLHHLSPPTYVVPPEVARDVEALFEAWRRLDRSEMEHELIALGPGQEWPLSREHCVRPFRSPHRVPCQGYAVWRRHRRLRPELRGLPQDELARLHREQDLDPSEEVEEPWVAFTGDTRIDVVDREEVVRRARLLVLEVTFLDDRVPLERARQTGHVHLDEVLARADCFENEALLFTHFSRRYPPQEVRAILDRRLPPSLRERVTALV